MNSRICSWAVTLFLMVSCCSVVFAQEDNPREFKMTEGDTTYVMKQYFMGFYLSGNKAIELTDEEVAEIQKQHLGHINKMAKAGQVAIAGPFDGDDEMRGILIFDVETQKEAEDLISEDPAVRAGRLTYKVLPWWAAKGSELP